MATLFVLKADHDAVKSLRNVIRCKAPAQEFVTRKTTPATLLRRRFACRFADMRRAASWFNPLCGENQAVFRLNHPAVHAFTASTAIKMIANKLFEQLEKFTGSRNVFVTGQRARNALRHVNGPWRKYQVALSHKTRQADLAMSGLAELYFFSCLCETVRTWQNCYFLTQSA